MSVINDMVDKACGLPPGWKSPKITLRCPRCETEKTVSRNKIDPSGAVRVEYPCDGCGTGGEVTYFNDSGDVVEI